MENMLGTDIVCQIGILCHDIVATAEAYKRVLGADYTVIETDCYELARTTYQGQPTEARVKQAFFDVGPNINIELIQPDEHPSTWRHDLDARGEGVHHIAFWVKGMDTVIARLDAAGMPMTQRGEWQKFFGIFGGLVVLTGLVSVFLIPEPKLEPRKEPYLPTLVYGLRPSVVKENPALYLSFAAFCLFSVAVQVFFPYLIIYMQNYLHFDGYALVLGIVLIFASVVSVLSGRVIDRLGELTCVLPAAGVMFAGLVGMFFARSMPAVIVTGCVMMSGYMLVTAILSGVIRDHTPAGKAGHFQGIRMIFGVLLPMILGPAIGAAVIRGSDSTYVDLGVVKTVPTPSIFLAAAVVLLLILPPVLALRKKEGAAC